MCGIPTARSREDHTGAQQKEQENQARLTKGGATHVRTRRFQQRQLEKGLTRRMTRTPGVNAKARHRLLERAIEPPLLHNACGVPEIGQAINNENAGVYV